MGRPLKFTSVEEVESVVDTYFKENPEDEWTVTGLCLALDCTRDTLITYGKKEDFFDTIKRAKLKIHNAYEKDLRKKGRSGDIFALKNFGWTDKSEVEMNANVTKMDKITKDGKVLEFDIGDEPTTENNENGD
jgi:hypothetical protein